ncbi:MAG: DDE-type integrase/transposase/recombinase [Bacillota bacterium]
MGVCLEEATGGNRRRKPGGIRGEPEDDFSRYVPHAEIYLAEKLPMLEECLKKALIKHGVPEQIYVDNGAIYSAQHFRRILGHLGVELIHSRPYRPQGRGKQERYFHLVQTSFASEAYRLLE